MNPKVLQYLVGHSDISVTLNTYAHTDFEMAEAELKKMNNAGCNSTKNGHFYNFSRLRYAILCKVMRNSKKLQKLAALEKSMFLGVFDDDKNYVRLPRQHLNL